MGLQKTLPSASFLTIPGRTSTACIHESRNKKVDLSFSKNPAQDTAASNAAFEVLDLVAGLVDIEGADDNQPRWRREISFRHRDAPRDVLADAIHVVFELRGNGEDWRVFGNSAIDELEDLFVLFLGLRLLHQVDFVLENQYVLKLHDLNCGEML